MAVGYFDFTSGAVLTAAQLEDYCELQSIMRFASASARNSALASVLIEGLRAQQSDTNCESIYSGSAWSTIGPLYGALTSWTPTVTQNGSVSITVNSATYQRIGRKVEGWFKVTATGSGSSSNAVIVGGLPFTAATSDLIVGEGSWYDVSIPSTQVGQLWLGSTTTFDIRGSGADADTRLGVFGLTTAIASGDVIRGHFCYEAASDA